MLMLMSPIAVGQANARLTIEQNRLAELTFTSAAKYDDPFNTVTLDAIITTPAGTKLTVPGYWDGGDRWRVRYSSPTVGTYTYETRCSDAANKGLHGQTGGIEIVKTTSSNPLLLHGAPMVGADRRHFTYADGAPFFWLGDTWWMGLCHRLAYPEEFTQLMGDRVGKGFTVIQIVAGLYPDMPPFDPRGANEAGFPWEKDYTCINPAYFQHADERLLTLVENGLTPCLVGAWGYFAPWMGEAKLKQHWRYLVARYGALPIFWCIAGEANLPYYLAKGFPYDDREQVKTWTAVAKYVREIDPYHRPLTLHPTGLGKLSARGAIDDPALLDYDMLQTGHGDRDVIIPTMKTFRWSYGEQPTMPVLNGEVSYEKLMDKFTADPGRLAFWGCMLSGAAGHTYGANGIWQLNRKNQPHGNSPHGGNYGTITWQEAMILPGSTQLSLGKKLLEKYGWEKFTPHPEWAAYEKPLEGEAAEVNALFAAGIPGKVRFVYVPANASIVVKDIEPQVNYYAKAFDAVGGQIDELVFDPAKPVTPPSWCKQDWLLILYSK